jgi:hypothetical protein
MSYQKYMRKRASPSSFISIASHCQLPQLGKTKHGKPITSRLLAAARLVIDKAAQKDCESYRLCTKDIVGRLPHESAWAGGLSKRDRILAPGWQPD